MKLVMPDLTQPQPERIGNTWVIRTDIVYNSFFFISGAEEILVNERDEHNRFLARNSLLGQDDRLMTPLIDEYGRMLLRLLGLPMPEEKLTPVAATIGFAFAQRRSVGSLSYARCGYDSALSPPERFFRWCKERTTSTSHRFRAQHQARPRLYISVADAAGRNACNKVVPRLSVVFYEGHNGLRL